jgi:hypothetical protein
MLCPFNFVSITPEEIAYSRRWNIPVLFVILYSSSEPPVTILSSYDARLLYTVMHKAIFIRLSFVARKTFIMHKVIKMNLTMCKRSKVR